MQGKAADDVLNYKNGQQNKDYENVERHSGSVFQRFQRHGDDCKISA